MRGLPKEDRFGGQRWGGAPRWGCASTREMMQGAGGGCLLSPVQAGIKLWTPGSRKYHLGHVLSAPNRPDKAWTCDFTSVGDIKRYVQH